MIAPTNDLNLLNPNSSFIKKIIFGSTDQYAQLSVGQDVIGQLQFDCVWILHLVELSIDVKVSERIPVFNVAVLEFELNRAFILDHPVPTLHYAH